MNEAYDYWQDQPDWLLARWVPHHTFSSGSTTQSKHHTTRAIAPQALTQLAEERPWPGGVTSSRHRSGHWGPAFLFSTLFVGLHHLLSPPQWVCCWEQHSQSQATQATTAPVSKHHTSRQREQQPTFQLFATGQLGTGWAWPLLNPLCFRLSRLLLGRTQSTASGRAQSSPMVWAITRSCVWIASLFQVPLAEQQHSIPRGHCRPSSFHSHSSGAEQRTLSSAFGRAALAQAFEAHSLCGVAAEDPHPLSSCSSTHSSPQPQTGTALGRAGL